MARDTYSPGSGGSSVLLVTGPDPVALPEGLSGFTGALTRAGRDLLVEMPDGTALRLVDYFTHGAPDLVHANDAVLPGAVAERLAGPLAPGQYAQVGGADPGAPIGQVETLEGSAEVQRADGTVVALRVGTEIFANDLVTTGDGSTAALTFLDGTVFTLAADSRMLIDNLIYDPNGGQNASGFNLIQGGFVFIAGAIAPTGNMEVTTPTASMGIRGTTVSVEIRTDEGVTRVQVALNPDPDGGLGRIELFDLQGNLLGTITTTDISWIVSPVEGETRVLERSFAPDSPESALLDTAIRAFQSAITRAQSGSATQTDGSGTPDVILDFGEDGSFDEQIFGDDEGGDALIDLIRDIVDGDDTVTLPNLAPVAVPIDAGSVAETAAPVVIDLLAGQRDPNGDALTISDVTVTAGETAVAFTLDGTVVTIDPAQFVGLGTGDQADITIRYSLSDGTLSVENTASLTVTGVNTAPVVADVTIPAATVLAGGGFDATPDLDGWTASTATTGLSSVSFSEVGVDRSGTALSNGDDAVAVLRFSGTATSLGGSGTGPTLTSDLVAVQAGDTLRVTYDLISGAATGNWDNGSVVADLVDGSGTVVQTLFLGAASVGSSTGLQTLDLTLTQTGTYGVRFTLQSTDGTFGGVVGSELRIGEATLTRAGATESAPYSFDAAVLTDGASDPDGGTVALLSVAGTSTAGARVSLAEGRISYDPDGVWDHLAAGETGTDTFTFTVSDGQGGTTTATATITVSGEGAGAELFAGAPLLDDLITLPDLGGFASVIVNGFSGVDTAAFAAGSADPFGTVDLRGIEVLDLTNGAADDVTVTLNDLLAMSDEADTRLQALLGDPVDAAGGVYRTILGEEGDTIRLAPSAGVDVRTLPDGEGQAGGSYGGHTDVSVWQFTYSGTGEVLARLAIDDDVTTHVVAPT